MKVFLISWFEINNPCMNIRLCKTWDILEREMRKISATGKVVPNSCIVSEEKEVIEE